MNQMSIAETAYLAGIFDGEGWFVTNEKSNHCRISVAMTDLDIIEKLQKTTGVGNLNIRESKNNKKTQYGWIVNKMEDVEDLVYAMLPFLSARRTERAKEVLAYIENRKVIAEWRLIHFVCGHEKSEDNTYHFPESGPNNGKIACRTCQRKPRKGVEL